MALNLNALGSILGRTGTGGQNLVGVPVQPENLVALRSATEAMPQGQGQGQVQALGNILQTMTAPQSRAQAAGVQMGGPSLPMFSARPEDPAGFTRLEPQDAYKKIFEALQSGQLTSPVTPPTPPSGAADQVRPPQQDTARGNPYAAFRTSVADTLKRISGISIDDEYFKGLFPQGGPQEFVNRFTEVFGPALSRNFSGLNTIRTAGKTFGNRQSTT